MSLLYFDGRYSHAAVKRAKEGEVRVQPEFGGSEEQVDAPEAVFAEGKSDADLLRIVVAHQAAEGRVLVTRVNAEQAAFKCPLVAKCRRVVAVLDSTKWNQVGLASFATLGEIDAIITDADAPPQMVARARDAGIEIQIV